jgi:hypothetical protein
MCRKPTAAYSPWCRAAGGESTEWRNRRGDLSTWG